MCTRSAFTLVEVLVVLFVIGLIATLAIKGSDIVDSASVRTEVRKLERFEVALSTNLLRKSKTASIDIVPGDLGDIVPAYFLDNTSLSPSDFFTLKLPETETYRKKVIKGLYDNVSGSWEIEKVPAIMVYGYYTPHTVCVIDITLDDSKPASGRGITGGLGGGNAFVYTKVGTSTLYTYGIPTDVPVDIFSDCSIIPNEFDNTSFAHYYYRLY